MIIAKRASPADGARWDTYVQGHPHGLLGHQFAWFSALAEIFKLEAHYWLVEENGEIIGIAPFFLRRHLGLGMRLTSMPYLNTGGILSDTPAACEALWANISAWALDHKIDSIELRHRHEILPNFVARSGRSASIIPLPDSEAAAWDQMRSVARNRVRKAQKEGLVVQHGFEHFEGFWRAYAENMLALGAPVLTRRFFLTLAARPELDAHLITLSHQNETVAGMVLLGFKDGVENGWTSSTLGARALYCNDLLYWEAIRWAVARCLRWLDLGRSEAGGGHEQFKEKFGAQTIALPYQELQRASQGWAAVTNEPEGLYHAFSSVWKRLPLRFATRIGPYFSRQVY